MRILSDLVLGMMMLSAMGRIRFHPSQYRGLFKGRETAPRLVAVGLGAAGRSPTSQYRNDMAFWMDVA